MKSRSAILNVVGTVLILLTVCVQTLWATEWSYQVYPSEDELLEAFVRGEIDYTELRTLTELSYLEIETRESYLVDQIPNVTYFGPARDSLTSFTESIQQAPFVAPSRSIKSSGDIRYRYSVRPDQNDASAYRFRSRYNIGEHVSTDFGLRRDLSGRERITHRTVELTFARSTVRRVALGSFRHRIGLGSLIGFRGRMVSFDNEVSGESLAYPDYGGFNGFLAQGGRGDVDYELIVSNQRDEEHSISTTAGDIFFGHRQLRTGVAGAVSTISNRSNGAERTDTKSSVTTKYRYGRGYFAGEATIQAGDFGSSGAILIEGRHRFEPAEIRYSFWNYGDEFADIASGSKSASLRRHTYYDDIDYKISSRRSGQRGGMFRTVAVLAEGFRLISSAIYAEAGIDSSNSELSAALSLDLTKGWQGQVDLISRKRNRGRSSGAAGAEVTKIATELKYRSTGTNIRTRFTINDDASSRTYFSLLTDIKFSSRATGELRLWSNLSRFRNGAIDYWYGFVEQRRELIDRLLLGIKLSHAYTRSRTVSDRTTISVELRAFI